MTTKAKRFAADTSVSASRTKQELDELRELIATEFGGIADKGFYFDRLKEVAAELRALRANQPKQAE